MNKIGAAILGSALTIGAVILELNGQSAGWIWTGVVVTLIAVLW